MSNPLSLVFSLSSRAHSITRQLDRSLSMHGISLTEFSVLDHLQRADQPLTQVALADRIGLTPSGMTRLVNPMVKRHLLDKQRNERDARQSLIQLTDAGEEILSDARVTCDQVAQSCTRRLAASKQQTLLDLLEQLA